MAQYHPFTALIQRLRAGGSSACSPALSPAFGQTLSVVPGAVGQLNLSSVPLTGFNFFLWAF